MELPGPVELEVDVWPPEAEAEPEEVPAGSRVACYNLMCMRPLCMHPPFQWPKPQYAQSALEGPSMRAGQDSLLQRKEPLTCRPQVHCGVMAGAVIEGTASQGEPKGLPVLKPPKPPKDCEKGFWRGGEGVKGRDKGRKPAKGHESPGQRLHPLQ